MLHITPVKNTNLQKFAQEKLMRVIPFTDADLAMNDGGFFSDAQQNRLKPKTDLYIALSIIGTFVGFVFAAIFFFVGQNASGYLFPTAVSLVVFGVCFYGIFWGLALANQIKKGYGVKKTEGVAELSISYSGRHTDIPVYTLTIQNVYFRLNEQTYNAFETGEYRVYYFRLLRNELLSVEPVN
jgi:hypothetical protein